MESPLGLKLRERGYDSFWAFLAQHGFTTLDEFRTVVDFPSLIPVGFHDFLIASADIENQWHVAYRVASAESLNNARERFRDSSPSPDWIVIQPVSFVASTFSDEVDWAQATAFRMRDYLLDNRHLFEQPFAFDDDWLIQIVDVGI
ncbi:MAG: hypothetical protein NXI22_16105 [bacterium]|nr:hypothetical protein [bacterium]